MHPVLPHAEYLTGPNLTAQGLTAAPTRTPSPQSESGQYSAFLALDPELLPTPNTAAGGLAAIPPPPTFADFRRSHQTAPASASPDSNGTTTPYSPQKGLAPPTPSPLHAALPPSARLGPDEGPASAAAAASPLLAAAARGAAPFSGVAGCAGGRRYLQFAEPEGLPVLEEAAPVVRTALTAMARRARERLLQRKPHLRAVVAAGPIRAQVDAAAAAAAAGGSGTQTLPAGGVPAAALQQAHAAAPPQGPQEELTAEEEVVAQRLAKHIKQMVLDSTQAPTNACDADGATRVSAAPPPCAGAPTGTVLFREGSVSADDAPKSRTAARVIRRGGKAINVKPRSSARIPRVTRAAARAQAMQPPPPQPGPTPAPAKRPPPAAGNDSSAAKVSTGAPSGSKRPAEKELLPVHAFANGWDEGDGVTAVRITDVSMHAMQTQPQGSEPPPAYFSAGPSTAGPSVAVTPLQAPQVAPEATLGPARGDSAATSTLTRDASTGGRLLRSGASTGTAAGSRVQLLPAASTGAQTATADTPAGVTGEPHCKAPALFTAGTSAPAETTADPRSSRGKVPALRSRAPKPPRAPQHHPPATRARAKPATRGAPATARAGGGSVLAPPPATKRPSAIAAALPGDCAAASGLTPPRLPNPAANPAAATARAAVGDRGGGVVAAAAEGSCAAPVDGWEVFESVMGAKGERKLNPELEVCAHRVAPAAARGGLSAVLALYLHSDRNGVPMRTFRSTT